MLSFFLFSVDKKHWFRYFKFDVQRCLTVSAFEDGMKYITIAEARFTPKDVLLACANDDGLKNIVIDWYVSCMELMIMIQSNDMTLPKADAMRKVVDMFMNRSKQNMVDYHKLIL